MRSLNRTHLRQVFRPAILAVLASAAACSDAPGPSTPTLQVTFTTSTDSVFYGRRMQGWVHTYVDAKAVDRDAVVWSSSDTLVAVVNQEGVVTGVGVGTARIIVDRPGERGEKLIRVVAYEPVPGVRFSLLSRGMDGVCAQAENGGTWCGVCPVTQGGGNVFCNVLAPDDTVPRFVELRGSRTLHFNSLHTSTRSQCGYTSDGLGYCWGQNAHGHFGTGESMSALHLDAPVVLASGRQFSGGSVGGHSQSCGIGMLDLLVYCFGHNDRGQVGRGRALGTDSSVAPVTGQLQARLVATGGSHTCAVDAWGELYCWGANYGSSIDHRDDAPAGIPVHLPGAPELVHLTIGTPSMCGLDADGRAWCWTQTPELVDTPLRFRTLSAGRFTTCGTTDDASIRCWGKFHPLAASDRLPPTDNAIHRIARGEKFKDVSVGWHYACGLTIDGRLLCW